MKRGLLHTTQLHVSSLEVYDPPAIYRPEIHLPDPGFLPFPSFLLSIRVSILPVFACLDVCFR
jgi:hypothetical protein